MLKDELLKVMENLEDEKIEPIVRDMLSEGYGKHEILELLNIGVKRVGDKYEKGEYFIADLIVSGVMYRSALSLMSTEHKDTIDSPVGKVVIGVMSDDFHDIGKDIVVDILRAEGFSVIDLGVDVKPEQFVRAVTIHKPDILLLSGVMKFVHDSMKETIRLLNVTGLREGLAILVGGSCTDATLHTYVLADQSARDPMDTLKFCKKVIAGNNNEC